jgi:hypothetical protein
MPVGYASRTDVAVGANALRRPEKAANTLNRGSLTASLQLTMAFAACREWLHSAVFRPEMQLMQLLQLFAYKKTERHPGDTWGEPSASMPSPKRNRK